MSYCEMKVVIGSWGSYNACNKRALGSSWIDLSDYSDWSEIEEELERQGFELDGIDEELFIQDIEDISALLLSLPLNLYMKVKLYTTVSDVWAMSGSLYVRKPLSSLSAAKKVRIYL